jgi:hypothetical protein
LNTVLQLTGLRRYPGMWRALRVALKVIWRGPKDTPDPEPGNSAQTPAESARPEGSGETPAWEAGSVGARIESVLEAAERAASGIRQDAEERAHRYFEESRQKTDEMAAERLRELTSLTDDLITRARSVAQRSQELIAALEDAGRRVAEGQPTQASVESSSEKPPVSGLVTSPPPAEIRVEKPEPEPVPSALRPSPPKTAGTPPAGPGLASRPKSLAGNSAVSEGARLLATQMAVAGSSREKISSRLQEEFGIQDPRPILDEIGI